MRSSVSPAQSSIRLLVLEGDGIGPEITAATMDVLHAANDALSLQLAFERADIGLASLHTEGTTLPDAVVAAAKAADGVVLGPVSHNAYPPLDQGGINPSGALRKQLDLYANIRPAKSRTGFPPRCGTAVDLVIVRENTEGFYADRNMFMGSGELMPTPDLAISMRKITREGSTRIAETAFALAMRRRRKITNVHKANVFRVSDGFYLDCVRAVAKKFPAVAYEERIVDAMAALLVRDASQFDVIVTTNMFGDILSDEASEISGSLGLAASINAGREHCLAQAQHGSADVPADVGHGVRVVLRVGAGRQQDDVEQDVGEPDGRDHRRRAGDASQWPERDPLDGDPENASAEHSDHERDEQHADDY